MARGCAGCAGNHAGDEHRRGVRPTARSRPALIPSGNGCSRGEPGPQGSARGRVIGQRGDERAAGGTGDGAADENPLAIRGLLRPIAPPRGAASRDKRPATHGSRSQRCRRKPQATEPRPSIKSPTVPLAYTTAESGLTVNAVARPEPNGCCAPQHGAAAGVLGDDREPGSAGRNPCGVVSPAIKSLDPSGLIAMDNGALTPRP